MTFGLGLALAITAMASDLVDGLRPIEPLVVLTPLVLLGAIALIATYLPARRAARISPVEALKVE